MPYELTVRDQEVIDQLDELLLVLLRVSDVCDVPFCKKYELIGYNELVKKIQLNIKEMREDVINIKEFIRNGNRLPISRRVCESDIDFPLKPSESDEKTSYERSEKDKYTLGGLFRMDAFLRVLPEFYMTVSLHKEHSESGIEGVIDALNDDIYLIQKSIEGIKKLISNGQFCVDDKLSSSDRDVIECLDEIGYKLDELNDHCKYTPYTWDHEKIIGDKIYDFRQQMYKSKKDLQQVQDILRSK